MKTSISRLLRYSIGPAVAAAVLLTITPCIWAWQNSDDEKPAADVATETTDEAAAEEAPVDPLVVPDGTPAELTQYLDELAKYRPAIRTRDELIKFTTDQATAMLGAANKILENEVKPTDEEIERAIQAKLQAFSRFPGSGNKDEIHSVIEEAKSLPEQLEKLELKQYVKQARVTLLNLKTKVALQEAIAQKDTAPIKEALSELKALVVESGSDIDRGELNLISIVIRNVAVVGPMLGDNEIGLATYKDFSKLLQESENEMAISLAKSFEGTIRREELPGNPMPLAGFKLDGTPFNIDELEGKVVLVDFWATWCGPCLGEIPFMTEAYKAYHEKGFEIVGVSVDRDLDALKQFVEKRQTPWIILADTQPDREDYVQQASYYGVSGIPTMILIGKDGKVISTKARGSVLETELAKIFGPIPKEEAAEEEAEQTAE